MARRILIAAVVVLAAATLTAGAAADGLPVLGVDVGPSGVTTAGSPYRYVTLPSGRETIVARTARNGGGIVAFTRVHGTFTIPAVAYDGSASGLSADRSTLVLIQPRVQFPRVNTTFAVLDTKRGLRFERVFMLRGDFSFDAISPDGNTVFLIQYTSPADPTRYAVRAYDLLAGRLLARPIVDPREHQNAMRGQPITRRVSADGRWAYTLYDGDGKEPFVHALDTKRRTARCIDLPMLTNLTNVWQMRITPGGGGTLQVGTPSHSFAVIATRDFRVSVPGDRAASSGSGLLRWLLAGAAALAAILVVAAAVAVVRRWRTRPATA